MKLSIIIRCFNEEKYIGRLLAGIESQDFDDYEVILVDSGSTDSTLKITSKYKVQVIHIKPEDFSFGYALNIGCKSARGEIMLFASAHVYPLYTDWLNLMLKPFDDEKVGLVYGKQRGDDRNMFSEKQLFKRWFPDQSNYDQKIPFCNNANCAIRRSLWQLYKYDETLTGLEDLAWAKTILSQGYRIVYESHATIIHVHEQNLEQIRNRYMRESMALKKINPDFSFNIFSFIVLLVRNLIYDYIMVIKAGEFTKRYKRIWKFRFNQFYGTYLGYRDSRTDVSNILRKKYYYPPGELKDWPGIKERNSKLIQYNDE